MPKVLHTYGVYPPNWKEIAHDCKAAAGWKCIRCGHPNEAESGHVLTVHHMDGNKANCEWWNLLALCQRCHLRFQGRVNPDQPYMLEHSEWIKIYVGGFLAKKYLGIDIEKYKAMLFRDELATIEAKLLQQDGAYYLSDLRDKILRMEVPHQAGSGQILLESMQMPRSAKYGNRKIIGKRIRKGDAR